MVLGGPFRRLLVLWLVLTSGRRIPRRRLLIIKIRREESMNTDPLLYLRDKEKVLLADYLQWLVGRDYFGGSHLAINHYLAKCVHQKKVAVYDLAGNRLVDCSADDISEGLVAYIDLCCSMGIQEESVIGSLSLPRTFL